MARCRVCIAYENPLFAEGASNLLTDAGGIEVVDTQDNPDGTLPRLGELMPDVVIVETSGEEGRASPAILGLPTASVVGLDLSSNRLVTYRREQQVLAEAEEFIHIVRSLAEGNTGVLAG